MDELTADLYRLVRSLCQLMRSSGSDWHSWAKVARYYSGSPEAADRIAGLAELPEFKHLFHTHGSKVRLSSEGVELACGLAPVDENSPGAIADAVVAYARSLKAMVLKVLDYSIVAQVQNKFVHAVAVEFCEENLPTETPVQIACQDGIRVAGKLLGQESSGDVLYIVCDQDILPEQQAEWVVIDRSYLLTALAERLQQLLVAPDRMAGVLERTYGDVIANDDSAVVADRLAQLAAPWTRFLWGPPGAGKSFGLAHLVARLLKSHPSESILVVGPSNRAVDVATSHIRTRLAVHDLEHVVKNRGLMRFGYARSPEVLREKELLGPQSLDEINGRIDRLSRTLESLRQVQASPSQIAVAQAELLAAQEASKQAARDHVAQCSVVATTTTLAYMPASPISQRRWDTVIVDEVTMVTPAVCFFLAALARQRLLLAGDPCQLGPIYEATDPSREPSIWLSADIFSVAGISNGRLHSDSVDLADPRLARITSQRRCATEIWEQISELYPEVRFAAQVDRINNIAKLEPRAGASVAVLDTSDHTGRCELVRRSWQNMESAKLSVATAIACLVESAQVTSYRVAIISPYRAQVKLLRQLIQEERRRSASLVAKATIEAGTVHQFQGSEADIVIFDLVDGPGRKHLGLLLRGDAGTRLVNVAISRARGKLIVIANKQWCRTAQIAQHNPLLYRLLFRKSGVGLSPLAASSPSNNERQLGKQFLPGRVPQDDAVTITVSCKHCGNLLSSDVHFRGSMRVCPRCKKFTRIL